MCGKIDWAAQFELIREAFKPLPRGMPLGAIGYVLTIYIIRAVMVVAAAVVIIALVMSASQ